MQDPSFYSQIRAHVQPQNPQFAEQEHLKCPRCDSTNTKFCYYNNYNLSQPRYFCKGCRRYWTKGGALRNIPVGGGSRKNAKRSSAAKRTASASESEGKSDKKNKSGGGEASESSSLGLKGDDSNSFAGQFGNLTEGGAGGFSTLLGSSSSGGGGHLGNFADAPEGNGPVMGSGQNVVDPLVLDGSGNNDNGVGFLNGDGGQSWSGDSNEWTGLAMYTPGSSFHHKYLSK